MQQSLQDFETHQTHQHAREQLILGHIRFADKVSRKFFFQHNRGLVEFDELKSAALLGLCDAAQRFDESRGQNFETFSYMRIRGAMFDYLRRAIPSSRAAIPWLLRDTCGSDDAPAAFSERTAPGSLAELASVLEVMDEVNMRLWIENEPGSAELTYGLDADPAERAEAKSMNRYFHSLLTRLPEKEALIIDLYYFQGWNFEEMRERFKGASRSWLSRLHQRALDRMRELIQHDARVCDNKVQASRSTQRPSGLL